MTDYDAHTQQVRTAYERKIKDLQGRRELTPEAKQILAARVLTAANGQMSELQNAYEADRRKDYARIRKLFFTPGNEDGRDPASRSQSFRHAKDEAAKLGDAKILKRRLGEANSEDDTLMVKALLRQAHDNGMTSLVAEHLNEHCPDDAPQYKQLLTYQAEEDSPQSRFMRNAQFMLPKPVELGRFDDWKIRDLARSDLIPDDAA